MSVDICDAPALVFGDRCYTGDRPLVMGILNVTPDSFHDGGLYADAGAAVDHALRMVDDGADIIDIGGASSRPGSAPVSVDEEMQRVIPVVERIAREIDVPVSVDTTSAELARRALDAGARCINDISALRADPDMAGVVARSGATVVLMHMRGTPATMQADPRYDDVVGEVLAFLTERRIFAEERGIARNRILVDPGIGFGKTAGHNLALIARCGAFRATGCAVLMGMSRKSFIGAVTGRESTEDRIWGTAAVTAHCVMEGVLVHRVHDVRAMRDVCDMAAALKRASAGSFDGTV